MISLRESGPGRIVPPAWLDDGGHAKLADNHFSVNKTVPNPAVVDSLSDSVTRWTELLTQQRQHRAKPRPGRTSIPAQAPRTRRDENPAGKIVDSRTYHRHISHRPYCYVKRTSSRYTHIILYSHEQIRAGQYFKYMGTCLVFQVLSTWNTFKRFVFTVQVYHFKK